MCRSFEFNSQLAKLASSWQFTLCVGTTYYCSPESIQPNITDHGSGTQACASARALTHTLTEA